MKFTTISTQGVPPAQGRWDRQIKEALESIEQNAKPSMRNAEALLYPSNTAANTFICLVWEDEAGERHARFISSAAAKEMRHRQIEAKRARNASQTRMRRNTAAADAQNNTKRKGGDGGEPAASIPAE